MQMKILSVLCKLESPYFNPAVDSHTTAASWAFSGLLGGSLQRLLNAFPKASQGPGHTTLRTHPTLEQDPGPEAPPLPLAQALQVALRPPASQSHRAPLPGGLCSLLCSGVLAACCDSLLLTSHLPNPSKPAETGSECFWCSLRIVHYS